MFPLPVALFIHRDVCLILRFNQTRWRVVLKVAKRNSSSRDHDLVTQDNRSSFMQEQFFFLPNSTRPPYYHAEGNVHLEDVNTKGVIFT